jgi:hypothetical protein
MLIYAPETTLMMGITLKYFISLDFFDQKTGPAFSGKIIWL